MSQFIKFYFTSSMLLMMINVRNMLSVEEVK